MASNRVTRVEGLHSIESLESPTDEMLKHIEPAILKPRMKTTDSLTRPNFLPSPSNVNLEKDK